MSANNCPSIIAHAALIVAEQIRRPEPEETTFSLLG